MKNTDSIQRSDQMKQNEENARIELYISDLWRGFVKFWWICLSLSLIFAIAMFSFSYLSFTPRYTASATFTVQTQDVNASGDAVSSYSFYYNRTTAAQLSDTFPFILESNLLQETICEDLGVSKMPATISASTVTETNMFTMKAVGTDAQATYDTLVSAIENYPQVAEYVIGSTKLTMISEPVLPTTPSNSRSYLKRTVFAAGFGFLLGIAWIIVYAVFRNTIRTKQDIREKLKHKCLGVIPNVTFKKHNREVDRSILLTNPQIGEGFLEAIRALRNSVIQSAEGKHKVIMVTSAAPGEGKTTVTCNLASSLSKVEKRVLIVECDLRNPSVVNHISNCERRLVDENESLKIENVDALGVDLLTFKVGEKEIWRVINGAYLKEIFEKFSKCYDFIIVDTPPCALTSDSTIIAEAAETSILVIRQDSIRTTRIQYAIESLLSTDTRLIGCVLNGATDGLSGYGESYGFRRGRYGYGYGHYGYGYGYGYGDPKKYGRKEK